LVDSGAGQINLVVPNNAPVVQNFSIGAQSGVLQTITIIGGKPVYAPSDADSSDTLAISAVTQGTNGGVVAFSSTGVTYSNNVVGADSFTYTVSDGVGGMATATVVVTVTAVVNQQTPSLTYNGTNVMMTFWGIPGYAYTVQSSTNLSTGSGWQNLIPPVTANDTNTQPSGQISFTDTNSATSPSWFYRLKP